MEGRVGGEAQGVADPKKKKIKWQNTDADPKMPTNQIAQFFIVCATHFTKLLGTFEQKDFVPNSNITCAPNYAHHNANLNIPTFDHKLNSVLTNSIQSLQW
jgi:hypothetical protein